MTAFGQVEVENLDRGLDRHDARAFLESTLERPRRGPVAISVPAPIGEPLSLLDRLRRGDAMHLHDERRALTALGATRLTRTGGPDRFAEAREAYESARDELTTCAHERAAAAGPVWTLGFAFAAGHARDVWTPLGDGLVTLPRWTHRVDGPGASLTLVVDRDEPTDTACALAEFDALWDALRERPVVRSTTETGHTRHVDEARWARSLGDVQARIRAGDVTKVVVARRCTITSEHDIDPVRVLRRLARPGATLFCVRRSGVTFIGATPERLFRKRARHVSTEAIAGTASLDRDPSGRRLLASHKDLHEHQLVVDAIRSALSGLRADVSIGSRGLRTLGSIAHLATPIDARLSGEVSAFELLAALHPTPAVGGVPRDAAMRWIAENEPDRGWYAGPLGWIDADGNAEVHVALRSALIVGARAYAYAGCGVVAGSDARAEYLETALKLSPMLAALGAPA